MKLPSTLGVGSLVIGTFLSLASGGSAAPEEATDPYLSLREALVQKHAELVAEASEALELAAGYEQFLEDPDVQTEEKPALRQNLVKERTRAKKLKEQALHVRSAVQQLRDVPHEQELTLTELQQAYQGLEDLGARGKSAWGELLSNRSTSVEALEAEYARSVSEATIALEAQDLEGRATQLLLDAIDSSRSDASDEEFHVALKLPRIKSAVALGFGIPNRPDDPKLEAQTTLLALIGYSQFFWDHFSGARAHLSESEFPPDFYRNIFGVADGEVLSSDAIAENDSSLYYLSSETRRKFNDRLEAIWGEGGTVTVKRWDQRTARTFFQACESLSTAVDHSLIPNSQAFELLEMIDGMIAEKRAVEEEIAAIHSDFQERIKLAKEFGEKVQLASASFNAELWAREGERLLAGFTSARKVLADELEASRAAEWQPRTKAIVASVQVLRKAQDRVRSVNRVKRDLMALLE